MENVTDVLRSFTKLQEDGKLSQEDARRVARVLESSQIKGIINMYDKLAAIRGEAGIPHPVTALSIEVMSELEKYDDANCRELFGVMNNPYFRGLIDAHDNIQYESYKCNPILPDEVCFS